MVTFIMPEVNSCCCFISLKTGAKLCGFITLVGCLFTALLSSSMLINIFGSPYILDLAINPIPSWAIHWAISRFSIRVLIIWLLGLDIVLQLVHVAASCCMIVGVYQVRATLIMPWLLTAILTAAMDLFIMDSLACRLLALNGVYYANDIGWMIIDGIPLVFNVYSWLVVCSYYRTIKTRNGVFRTAVYNGGAPITADGFTSQLPIFKQF